MARTITSHEDFWPFYLGEHSRPATRAFHYVGTLGFMTIAAYALATVTWWALAAAGVTAYALAWFSHFVIERNRPATFAHPAWSLVSDFRMLGYAATGRIGREFAKHQIRPRP
jgi:hypothetical protein